MTSRSSAKRRHTEISDYGFARARDAAFDAIRGLWAQRKAAGWKQSDVADRLGKDTAWLSRQLSGPGNWTLRTLGELCEAMDGELEIIAHRIEVPAQPHSNYHAYSGYGAAPSLAEPTTTKLYHWVANQPVQSTDRYRVVTR